MLTKINDKTNKIDENDARMNDNISPITLWGKIVRYLRENNFIALHIVCGDIREVDIQNDEFIIKTCEQYILDILSEKDNFNGLKSCFSKFGYDKIKILKIDKKKDINTDIETLNKFFGDKINIKK